MENRLRALAAGVACVVTLFGTTACGSGDAGHSSSAAPTIASTGTSTTSPGSPAPVGATGRSASVSCAIRPGSVCVTERAGGHTLQLTKGWSLTVRLGAPGRRFSPPRQSGQALQALGAPVRQGSEVVSVFRAVKAGTSQLRATERPQCRADQACPQYLVLWTLTVKVTG